jgi:hypothetical protein
MSANHARPLNHATRFSETDPMQFRVGDIVEVQMTIVAVPIQKNKFKVVTQLRTVALLDGTFTDVSWCFVQLFV